MPAVHDVHVLLHPSRKPLRQGGSCSAPKTTEPADAWLDAPPAVPTAIRLTAARPATTASQSVLRCIFPPFSRAAKPVSADPRSLHRNPARADAGRDSLT